MRIEIPEKIPDFSKKRMEICNNCEHLILPIKMCEKCFCFMPVKTMLKHTECPEKKWGKESNGPN